MPWRDMENAKIKTSGIQNSSSACHVPAFPRTIPPIARPMPNASGAGLWSESADDLGLPCLRTWR